LYAGKELWKGSKSRIGVCDSKDDGRTWNWLSAIPTRSGDDPLKYHELHAVQAADGRIVVQIRNHNPANAGETLQSESHDGGESWSVPRSIGVWGLPSHLLKLADGRLLMSYGYRRRPYGIQARISDDHGQSWSDPLVLSADGNSGDLGYPTTVQFPSGEFLTVWYELLKASSQAVLRQARWTLKG
ncbi:MAG: sialidase family protein, partial [Planctomycetaceae bacterium]